MLSFKFLLTWLFSIIVINYWIFNHCIHWYLFHVILYSKSHFDSNKSKKGPIEKKTHHIDKILAVFSENKKVLRATLTVSFILNEVARFFLLDLYWLVWVEVTLRSDLPNRHTMSIRTDPEKKHVRSRHFRDLLANII